MDRSRMLQRTELYPSIPESDTISDYLIKKLQERNDVTTVINFEYQQVKYRMTIPAGKDYTKLLEDQDYFYGYLFFANEIGATVEAL